MLLLYEPNSLLCIYIRIFNYLRKTIIEKSTAYFHGEKHFSSEIQT